MASSPQADQLTQAHYAAQARNAAILYLLVLRRWGLVKVDDIDESARAWLAGIVPIIFEYRRRSASLAARYYATFRALELHSLAEPAVARLAATMPLEQLRTSLLVTGPVAFKKKMRAVVADEITIDEALKAAGRTAAAAAVRHAGDGGRQTIIDTVTDDRLALAYARVTRAAPCYFCAMLASRGPVYPGRAFDVSDARFEGEGHAKVHDSCGCSMEPVFSADAAWPGRGREFEQLWKDSTRGKSGAAAVKAFRHAYEQRG